MIAAALIVAGYLGLILAAGWPGLLMAGAHIAAMLLASSALKRRP